MVNRLSKNKFIVAILATLFLVCSILSLSTFKVAKAEVTNIDVTEYYNQYKDFVTTVDENHEIFNGFYEQYLLTVNSNSQGNLSFFERMKDVVEVATLFKSFDNYSQDDYVIADWNKIEKIKADALLDATIKDANFDKQAIITKLNGYSSQISSNYKTFEEKFNIQKANIIAEIESLKNSLLYVNSQNPQGDEKTVVGFYDQTAKANVEEIYNEAIEEIEAINFVKGSTNESQLLVEKSEQYKILLDAEPKNDIFRAINAINDYYSFEKENPTDTENIELFKNLARLACQKAKDNFINVATKEVLVSLSNEVSLIENFPMGDFKPSDFEKVLVDNVKTSDEVFVVRAVMLTSETAKAVKVIPQEVEIKVHTNHILSAVKKNISKTINEYDEKLTVGYCFSIDLYDGSNKWKQVNEFEGERVVYQVEVDLEKYYNNYIENNSGALDKLLSNIGIKFGKVLEKNRFDRIVSADDYLERFDHSEKSSLVYSYKIGEGGERLLTPLNYKLVNGGILMFETTTFGTFSTAESVNNSLFANPLFWVIVVLSVIAIIIIISIIVKNKKYSVIFDSMGGSKVKPAKARRGDVYVMPNNPTKEGYVFGGWFLDTACTIRFVDTYVRKRKNVKVYAKWNKPDTTSKFIPYYEGLKNYFLSFSKVGPFADSGFVSEEIYARVFVSENGVKLFVNYDLEKLQELGYNVEESNEFEGTTTMLLVSDRESFIDAKEIVSLMLNENGFVAFDDEEFEPITAKEVEEGFVFSITNDKVLSSIGEYYEYIRAFSKCYTLVNPAPFIKTGCVLFRMYLEENVINLYFAFKPSGDLIDASGRFSDTPALLKVGEDAQDVMEACELIDMFLVKCGFVKDSSLAMDIKLEKAKEGEGFGFAVNLD